jgi:hypothetical protein
MVLIDIQECACATNAVNAFACKSNMNVVATDKLFVR